MRLGRVIVLGAVLAGCAASPLQRVFAPGKPDKYDVRASRLMVKTPVIDGHNVANPLDPQRPKGGKMCNCG